MAWLSRTLKSSSCLYPFSCAWGWVLVYNFLASFFFTRPFYKTYTRADFLSAPTLRKQICVL